MAEVKLRLNLEAEEVELVVDGAVALSSGPEVFRNWVEAYNEKHKPAEPVQAPEPAPVAQPDPAPVEEEKPSEPVDTEN